MSEQNELMVNSEVHGKQVAVFETGAAAVFCSLQDQSRSGRAKIANAMGEPTHKVGDIAGKVIMAKDVVGHKITLSDMETGEARAARRVVLLLENGETVAGVSEGFCNAIGNIMNVVEMPTWEPAMPLRINRVNLGKGKTTFNVEIIDDLSKIDKKDIIGGVL